MGIFSYFKNLFAEPKPGPLGPKPPETCPIEEPWELDPKIYNGWVKFTLGNNSPTVLFPSKPTEVDLKALQELSKDLLLSANICRMFSVIEGTKEAGGVEIFSLVYGTMRVNTREQKDLGYFLFPMDIHSLSSHAHPLGDGIKVSRKDEHYNCAGTTVVHSRIISKDSASDEGSGALLLKLRYFEWIDGGCYGVAYFNSDPGNFESERGRQFLMSLQPGKSMAD